eukprot:TRINITY_DN815_c0_g2_i1.p1 TRINITY_DN815_c0_g2~~TRINITY_DN815_c0_g2_i1.p1  ORF type:complete len:485 (+),score=81.51 TRINITY_DN815_c0_g2_i1:23-1477(+)
MLKERRSGMLRIFSLFFVASVLLIAVFAKSIGPQLHQYSVEASADQIVSLPGLPNTFKQAQYAGYVNVDSKHNRNIFYWFVESESNPATAPVVLWLNGGPGCSSLGGLFTENGPFWPTEGGSGLGLNSAAWSKVANMIWLESPAGVGFSYSGNTQDYTIGDNQTAWDGYNFLQGFFDRYPALRGNKFYVSGESYGGHYVPNLTLRIAEQNKVVPANRKINLAGFLVGNAWTDAPLDNLGAVDYWFQHGVISNQTLQGLIANCDFAHSGPYAAQPNDACDQFSETASHEMGAINIYDIFADVCVGNNAALQLPRLLRGTNSAMGILGRLLAKRDQLLQQNPTSPCIDSYTQSYLNRADVQTAIHARATHWTDCSAVVHYSYDDLLASVLPVYEALFKESIKILVYSGDVDAIVPFTGTRLWLDQLHMTIVTPLRTWSNEQQVAGWVTGYDQLTFATVRGAGHMVPGTQPDRALAMLTRFLHGEPL